MPIYEYRCTNCGHQQEFLQRVSDAPRTRCPQCNQETFSKMVTAAGFQLKGSGWYATDFKASGSKPAGKSEGAATKSESAATKSEGAATKSEGAATKSEGAATKSEGAATKSERSSESKNGATGPARGSGASPACQ